MTEPEITPEKMLAQPVFKKHPRRPQMLEILSHAASGRDNVAYKLRADIREDLNGVEYIALNEAIEKLSAASR